MHKVKFTSSQKTAIKIAFNGIDRDKLAVLLLKKKAANRNIVDQIAAGLSRVSAERAIKIERFTDGKVAKHILRPDIFEKAS